MAREKEMVEAWGEEKEWVVVEEVEWEGAAGEEVEVDNALFHAPPLKLNQLFLHSFSCPGIDIKNWPTLALPMPRMVTDH